MITLVKDIKEANGITHNGTMHADEVFATAFLSLYFGSFKVIRVSEVPIDISPNTLVYDIGKGKFDHHQSDARVREENRNQRTDENRVCALGAHDRPDLRYRLCRG